MIKGNIIYLYEVEIIYSSKKIIEYIDRKTNEQVKKLLVTYIVKEELGEWKQSIVVKQFESNLDMEVLEKGLKADISGHLKISSSKVNDTWNKEYEIIADNVIKK